MPIWTSRLGTQYQKMDRLHTFCNTVNHHRVLIPPTCGCCANWCVWSEFAMRPQHTETNTRRGGRDCVPKPIMTRGVSPVLTDVGRRARAQVCEARAPEDNPPPPTAPQLLVINTCRGPKSPFKFAPTAQTAKQTNAVLQ